MSIAKKVFQNVSYLLIARTAFRVLTAMVLIYAANYLGEERFGMMETALAWSNTFLALNDVGMSTLIVREAARDRKKMAVYFGNTLLVEVLFSVVLYAVIIGIGMGIGYNSTTITLMMILGAAGLVFELRKVMRGIFRVMMRLKFVAFLEVVNGALYLLTAIWIFAAVTDRDLGLIGLAHARLWVNVLIVIALFAYALKFVRPAFAPRQIWPMIKQSYVFTLYNMFFMLYFQIDQIILSIMRTQSEVGVYGASAKIVNVLLFIPLMVFQVTMPLMYRNSQNDMSKYKRINNAIWRYLAAFGVPAGVGLSLLAPQIIGLIYPSDGYSGSVIVLQSMGFFLAVRFVGIGQGNSLTTQDKQALRAGIQIGSVALNIVLDVVLIRQFGPAGAAAATLITESVIASSYLFWSARFLQESLVRNLLSLWPIIGATALMALAIRLANHRVHVMVLVLFGALVYLFFLWLFRFFRQYDKQLFKQILNR